MPKPHYLHYLLFILLVILSKSTDVKSSTSYNNTLKNDTNITQNTNSTRNDSSDLNTFSRSLFMNLFAELGDKSSICIVLLYKEVTPLTLFIVASSVETLFNL